MPRLSAVLAPLFVAALSAAAPPPAASIAPAAPPALIDPIVARVGDQAITLSEVDRAVPQELHELRERALEKLITDRAIASAAKRAGLTAEQFVRKQVEAQVPLVSEAEAKAFFEKSRERLGPELAGKKFEEVKDTIIQGLTGAKRHDAMGTVIEDLRRKAGVQVLLEAPRVQVAAAGPARGPATAKVTIVEFSDFQCPYCSRGQKVMEEVVKAYGDRVRLVFRDFPLSFHEHARRAAEAGQCAHEQGKFWALHDWMFEHQSSLDAAALSGAAKQLGLDGKRFNACLDGGKQAGTVAESMKVGEQAGVRGTPAFFVNGVFISGAQPFEKFQAEIDRALAR